MLIAYDHRTGTFIITHQTTIISKRNFFNLSKKYLRITVSIVSSSLQYYWLDPKFASHLRSDNWITKDKRKTKDYFTLHIIVYDIYPPFHPTYMALIDQVILLLQKAFWTTSSSHASEY